MSKIITIFVFAFWGSISLDACAAQNDPVNHVGHDLHGKGITKPVRNEEWYLKQIRKSGRFKAIALGSDGAKFPSGHLMVDHLAQQATIQNRPVIENNKATEGDLKKDSSLAKPNGITFMFVPAFLSNKLMDMQKRSDMPTTLIISWKE
jgi:hypothetical protein